MAGSKAEVTSKALSWFWEVLDLLDENGSGRDDQSSGSGSGGGRPEKNDGNRLVSPTVRPPLCSPAVSPQTLGPRIRATPAISLYIYTHGRASIRLGCGPFTAVCRR